MKLTIKQLKFLVIESAYGKKKDMPEEYREIDDFNHCEAYIAYLRDCRLEKNTEELYNIYDEGTSEDMTRCSQRLDKMMADDEKEKIKCKNIHLILGNHDPRSRRGQPREEFAALFKSCVQYHVARIPAALKLEDMLGAPKRRVILNHYAIRSWEGMHRGTYHLYGHSHATLPANGTLSFDCGVDAIALQYGHLNNPDNYRPTSSFEVYERLKDCSIKSVDGHHKLQNKD